MRSYRQFFQGGSLLLVAFSLLLSACQAAPSVGTPTAAAPQPTPAPTLTPTPAPRTLVICLGQEPQTLYLYGGSSQAQWSVLESIYDGPIDTRSYTSQPVILASIPAVGNGAVIQAVDVKSGAQVVDADGNLVALGAGVKVLPSGCNGADCAQTYDGASDFKMDQWVVTYKLLPGLKWSDGAPLTAADSVYSFKLAADPATPVSKASIDTTASYTAPDDTSVQWTGVPGYRVNDLSSKFWIPLPQHAWSQTSAADLLTADESNLTPLGWGPYVIDEWVKGDHILLHKNPLYFRAAEGLPKFDTLDFRFLGATSAATVNALLSGECDVVDQTSLLQDQLSALLELQKNNKLQVAIANGPQWEHLDFGIQPASYDNGYNPASGDRPDIFGDVRVRQAFAYCLDRQQVVDKVLLGQSVVPDSYVPPGHPLYDPNLPQYAFDPAKGSQLLDEVGWKDTDNNPATPRVATGVKGVPDGTPLVVSYTTTQATLRQQSSQILQASLAQCGIQANLSYSAPGDLFAEGPDGPVFGRKFDLVQFTWQSGEVPLCSLFESQNIPTAANHWVGVNVSGYSNPEFDAACQAATQARPDQPAYAENHQKAQAIFANDLPVIPLYMQIEMAAARPDFCGLQMDSTARSEMWNIENFDYGSGCKK